MSRSLTIALCAACGSSSAPAPSALRPAAPPPAVAEDGTLPAPGCPPAELAARRAELASIFEQMQVKRDAQYALDALRGELEKPCLRHIAPAIPIPPHTNYGEMMKWLLAIDDTMELHRKGGLVHVLLPPEIVPALPDPLPQGLAPFACPAGVDCQRVVSYVVRAMTAFSAREDTARARLQPRIQGTLYTQLPVQTCDGTWHDKPTTFEAWVSCVAFKAPHSYSYAAGFDILRPIDRGWLVLRGRRGHYESSNELRVYDLATGAAYVVRDTSYIIQTPDHTPQSEQYTGQVAPDQLREAAFVLLTKEAIVRVRTSPVYAVIPPAIERKLSGAPFDADWSRVTWSSDDQTELAYTYFDGALRRTGTVTWPEADDDVNNHITQLIMIFETGLVKGCAPAKLPPLADIGRRPDDAALEGRLEGLRVQACRK